MADSAVASEMHHHHAHPSNKGEGGRTNDTEKQLLWLKKKQCKSCAVSLRGFALKSGKPILFDYQVPKFSIGVGISVLLGVTTRSFNSKLLNVGSKLETTTVRIQKTGGGRCQPGKYVSIKITDFLHSKGMGANPSIERGLPCPTLVEPIRMAAGSVQSVDGGR